MCVKEGHILCSFSPLSVIFVATYRGFIGNYEIHRSRQQGIHPSPSLQLKPIVSVELITLIARRRQAPTARTLFSRPFFLHGTRGKDISHLASTDINTCSMCDKVQSNALYRSGWVLILKSSEDWKIRNPSCWVVRARRFNDVQIDLEMFSMPMESISYSRENKFYCKFAPNKGVSSQLVLLYRKLILESRRMKSNWTILNSLI